MRRISVLFALLAVCAPCVRGQDFRVAAKAYCKPATPVVGELCTIILELDVDRRADISNVEMRGLPEGNDSIVYGELENLADRNSATEGRVVKRMRMPVRFQKPVSLEASPFVVGMVGFVERRRGYVASESRNFGCPLGLLRFDVQPLPEHGRPANFSGAVGHRFEMKQTVDRDQVYLNDRIITATYTLDFDGCCPPDITPNVECPLNGLKVYPIKEMERTEQRVVWTQELVPQTAQVTNTVRVSVNYYNPQKKCYEVACAEPLKLTLVPTEAVPEENADGASSPSAEEHGPVVLRFAPSDASPVIARLPPGTPVKELATRNGWRRLETPRAIGWARK